MKPIISISEANTLQPVFRFNKPINVKIEPREIVTIFGKNGGGKTLLANIIANRIPLLGKEVEYDFSPFKNALPSDMIRKIDFRDSYGDYDSSYYYQQRWNQHDIDDAYPTVGELLEKTYVNTLNGMSSSSAVDKFIVRSSACEERRQRVDSMQNEILKNLDFYRDIKNRLYTLFNIHELSDKKILMLSSGEMRKFQLTKTLISAPKILIIDNPFIGLDIDARRQFQTILHEVTKWESTTLVLLLSRLSEIPNFVTHIIEVEKREVFPKVEKEKFLLLKREESKMKKSICFPENLHHTVCENCDEASVLEFRNITIKYDRRMILHNINWKIKQGEHCVLEGANGSGKSTLLSLVCADNPQAYACDITLFGKKRGSGESIWDIKRRIGYVSPELHRAFRSNLSTREIVASGLRDTLELYRKVKEPEIEIAQKWVNLFDIEEIADRGFNTLSGGEQRLVLLARAFVKLPDLLILDEPLHGLDDEKRTLVLSIIENYCKIEGKTVIMVTHYIEEVSDCFKNRLILGSN